MRVIPAVGCLLLAYALLIPGLTQPMLSVSGHVARADLVDLGRQFITESRQLPPFLAELARRFADSLTVEGHVMVFDSTRSILDTAQELYHGGHKPVALLILLFSVGVPLAKACLMLYALLGTSLRQRQRLMRAASASSKWSMADVFVIGIFVAYLSASGTRENSGLVVFDAHLGAGFYFFLGYCLISILGTQLLVRAVTRTAPVSAAAGIACAGADCRRETTLPTRTP